MQTWAVVLFIGSAVLGGCRSRLLSDTSPGGTPPVDGAAVFDASRPAPDLAGFKPTGLVNCGGSNACSIAAGKHCCIATPPICQFDPCKGVDQYDCDGPEDCGGSPCCFPVRNALGHATCATTCDRESSLCHTSADCPSNEVCCGPSVLGPNNGVCLSACD